MTPTGASGALPQPPASCPVCTTELLVTRLACPACGTEVSGSFVGPADTSGRSQPEATDRLVNLPEPHASLLELFLRVRGNVKDVERELGLSYPTVRARLEEAFTAARPKLTPQPAGTTPATPPAPAVAHNRQAPARGHPNPAQAAQRADVLGALERGEITAAEATMRLRDLTRSQTHER
jgi:hypothetical protein